MSTWEIIRRIALVIVCGLALVYMLTSVATMIYTQIDRTFSSLKKWTSQISINSFALGLSMEIPHLALYNQTKQVDVPQTSTLLLEMLTSFNPKDPRTLIRSELPGFAFFDGELIIPGQGGNYTDIPIESAPPLEVVLAEREAVANGLNGTQTESEQESPEAAPSLTTGGRKVVFIYHTHNRESWLPHVPSAENPNEAFHAEVNITKVGVRLGQELEKRGIGNIVDTTDIAQRLAEEKLPFSLSYAKSREVVEEVMAREPDILFMFDLHRDALPRERTTIEIDGKTYARTFFIVGGRNSHYEKNLAFAERLHELLEEAYPGLSRGVYLKEGGDGEYNQSLSEYNLLIEIGGVENNLEESYRTAEALADVIADLYWDALKVDAPMESNKS